MFKSFFPKPGPFFISAFIWALVAVVFWQAGGGAWVAHITGASGDVPISAARFWSLDYLIFYAYYILCVGVFALFSSVVATDVALSGYVHLGSPNTDVVSALWTLHNSLFGILGIALGIALAGFSAAAAAGGLVAAPWKQAGGVAALLLAVSAATTPLALDGSPVMFVGLVGFLVWLVFVATTSRALLGNR